MSVQTANGPGLVYPPKPYCKVHTHTSETTAPVPPEDGLVSPASDGSLTPGSVASATTSPACVGTGVETVVSVKKPGKKSGPNSLAPMEDRCIAVKPNGERCKFRKNLKKGGPGCQYCGKHLKLPAVVPQFIPPTLEQTAPVTPPVVTPFLDPTGEEIKDHGEITGELLFS